MSALQQPKIFIVESQYIVAADLAVHLGDLGHQYIGIYNNYNDVVRAIDIQRPYLIIISMALYDDNDGVLLAQQLHHNFQLPIAFMSSSTDRNTFQLAMDIKPYAFFTKPFDRDNIQRGLKHATDRTKQRSFHNWKHQHQMKVVKPNATTHNITTTAHH